MCGLFGFLRYGNEKINVNTLTESLSFEAAIRGTDATGIAYNNKHLKIYKKPVSAYKMKFNLPDVYAAIGHTRAKTTGSETKNYNNHPFMGSVGRNNFALAHNGVLINDVSLRTSLNIPKTKVETDSYIAVQLIEKYGKLNMKSLAYMAEHVEGSFSFSILDNANNIYLVKGDSPLYILHFPKHQLYVYASTPSILWKALVDTTLFKSLKASEYEEVDIYDGEIVKICNTGNIKRGNFEYNNYFSYGCDWRSYRTDSYFDSESYIDDIKNVASGFGYTTEDIDCLLEQGFAPDEIEEIFYGVEV